MKTKFYFIAIITTLFVSCSSDPNSPGVEYMPDMYQSPAAEYYGTPNLVPPSQTIPFEVTQEDRDNGKELFGVFCAVCHGETGLGDGTVPATGKFPQPPAYKNLSTGYIFNTITEGKNAMASYSTLLTPNERWQVTAYVREIQG